MAETQTGSDSAVAATATAEDSTFSSLLKQSFKPATDEKAKAIERAVSTLCDWALRNATVISDDTIKTVEALIAEIDQKLTAQVNEIIHHPDYQKLEGAWRGLHYLVNNTATDEMLQIRVLPVSKTELHKTLKKFQGTAWDQSPIFKSVYEEEYGKLGGNPYGCLIGDFYFDHSPTDVETLGELAKIAAAAHAPFISAAAPSVMGMGSWQELGDPRDLTAKMSTVEHADWRSLRQSEDSRYVGLTMPRELARRPYGAKSTPVAEFAFEEDTAAGKSDRFCWMNAAYAMAVNINRSFKDSGWCTQIRGVESGGAVNNLPTYTFPTDDGGKEMTCPTEIGITDRREAELAKNGFIPLIHRKNTNMAAFMGAQSLQEPKQYDDPDATANAMLSARLPYLFACSRFAHYLKVIVRDKIGKSFSSEAQVQAWLKNWIRNYVHGNPAQASDLEKAKKPLAAAEVIVEKLDDNPGYYNAQFLLRPHYQLEGLTVALKLVSRLPSERK
jgi:type VI secretion system protein ImpC